MSGGAENTAVQVWATQQDASKGMVELFVFSFGFFCEYVNLWRLQCTNRDLCTIHQNKVVFLCCPKRLSVISCFYDIYLKKSSSLFTNQKPSDDKHMLTCIAELEFNTRRKRVNFSKLCYSL